MRSRHRIDIYIDCNTLWGAYLSLLFSCPDCQNEGTLLLTYKERATQKNCDFWYIWVMRRHDLRQFNIFLPILIFLYWKFLTTLLLLWQFWILFYNLDNSLFLLAVLTISSNLKNDNSGKLWHWSETGQHLQFLRCLNFIRNTSYNILLVTKTDIYFVISNILSQIHAFCGAEFPGVYKVTVSAR